MRGLEPEAGSGARAEGASCRRAPEPSVGGVALVRNHGRGSSKGRPLLHSSVSGDAPGGWGMFPSKPVGPSGPIREWRTSGLTSRHTRGGWAWSREELWHREQQAHRCPPCCQHFEQTYLPLPLLLISTPFRFPPGPPPPGSEGGLLQIILLVVCPLFLGPPALEAGTSKPGWEEWNQLHSWLPVPKCPDVPRLSGA